MNRLKIAPHQSLEELEQHYRQAEDGVARSQWQIIWLLASGRPSAEVAAITGYSLDWVRKLAQRYNEHGPAGMGDGRHRNPGRALSLSAYQQKQLKALLSAAAAHGERWSGREVAAWMSARLKRNIYPQRGWEMLCRLGFRPTVGRPRHVNANIEDQTAYKKPSSPE